MNQKLKTHFEEVPLEVAQRIAEEQIAIHPSQATRSGQLRDPTKKRSRKALQVNAKAVRGRKEL
jgi:hypothetical protein